MDIDPAPRGDLDPDENTGEASSESDSDSELDRIEGLDGDPHNTGFCFLELPPDDPDLHPESGVSAPVSPTDSEEHYQESGSGSGSGPDLPHSYSVPGSVYELQDALLHGYSQPPFPPTSPPQSVSLTTSETVTLEHYVAWHTSNGTVRAYSQHAEVLRRRGEIVLTLHSARRLAVSITGLSPASVDICPHSCIAYTGKFSDLDTCPYLREKKICGQPQYRPQTSGRQKPRSQMMTLPVMATIKAMYANEEASHLLRHRDRCLKRVLDVAAYAAGQKRTYSDFCDSDVHLFLGSKDGRNLFQDPRDVALAVSSDGAQLTMKQPSDTWILIITLLNMPPEIRYRTTNVIQVFVTPGPRAPGDIESFCYPLFEEMARASEGIWTWDAVDSSYFVLHAWVVAMLGDMLGSAKFSGMAGHTAVYGDRFSLVKGARSSTKKGSKFQYYPTTTIGSSGHNPERLHYDLYDLPMRTEEHYWATIEELNDSRTKAERARAVTNSGISRMPLAAASPAFLHPSFFPLDPFHLFYENCMAFFWDTWTSTDSTGEKFHLDRTKTSLLGHTIAEAMSTLPPLFCGPIRDPFLKRNSQYKIYEWMGLLHWYLIPLGLELDFDLEVLTNFADFVEAIEIAMTPQPRTLDEIGDLHTLIAGFLNKFEEIYIGNNEEKIFRCRLCIFQLIHVPRHIYWNGSVRVGSQATVERAIGEVGRKVRSKKAPFANLANLVHERELVKLLLQYCPDLRALTTPSKKPSASRVTLSSRVKIRRQDNIGGTEHQTYMQVFRDSVSPTFGPGTKFERWAKLFLPRESGYLHSALGELRRSKCLKRSTRFFEVCGSSCHINTISNTSRWVFCQAKPSTDSESIMPLFGEAMAFYEVLSTGQAYVVYRPITGLLMVLRRWQGTWANQFRVLQVDFICAIIGIWQHEEHVHILRKHPGLYSLVNAEDKGMSMLANSDSDVD